MGRSTIHKAIEVINEWLFEISGDADIAMFKDGRKWVVCVGTKSHEFENMPDALKFALSTVKDEVINGHHSTTNL